jgi:hypothetical protein
VRSKIRSQILVALLAATMACFVCAVPAWAGIGAPVIADCQAHDGLTEHFSIAQLKNAAATLPADVSEYTNCQQAIERALTSPNGPGTNNGAGSGSGGSFLPTPVIVVLVLLILAAVTFGALSVRRRREPPSAP